MTMLNLGLVFYCRPHLGGSGIMTLELAKQLKMRGHGVSLLSYPGTFLTEEEKDLGLELHAVPDIDYPCFKAEPYTETFTSLISNLSSKGKIDLVHANYAITHGLASVTAKRYLQHFNRNLGVVTTNHGSDIHTNGSHDFLAPSIEHILLESDAITFVSNDLKNQAEKLFPLIEGKGEVIYNFVDSSRFVKSDSQKLEMRLELGIPKDAVVVYHASNFRDLKNTEIFLEVAEMDKNSENPLYFLLVGEGPNMEGIQNLSSEYGDRFKFVGRKEDVVPYINTSDIAVLPSKRESFGLMLLEAMSCELPVVGSNRGGIPEVISECENGYTFPLEEPESLYGHLRFLADNPQIRKKMGENSSKISSSSFALDSIVSKYENLYENVLRSL